MSRVALFLMALVILIALDSVWLGYLMRGFYREQMTSVVGRELRWFWSFVIATYLTLVLGLIVFVLNDLSGSPLLTFSKGALFGFVLYGVYQFTNYAVFPNWSGIFVVVDTLWGTFVCGTTALLVALINRWLTSQ